MQRNAPGKLFQAARCLERAAQAARVGVGGPIEPDCPHHKAAAKAEIKCAQALIDDVIKQVSP